MTQRKKNILIFLAAACYSFVISCKSNDGNSHFDPGIKSQNTTANENYHFNLHLKQSAKFEYTIDNETETKLEVNDKKIKTDNEATIKLVYEVIKDSDSTKILGLTYQKIHVVIKKTDAEDQILDSDTNSDDMDLVERALSVIKGSSLFITLNSKGQVVSVAGAKEISDKVMSLVSSSDPKLREMMAQMVSKLSGDEFVQENLKNGFKIFPDGAVKVGDSWNLEEAHPGELNFKVNSKSVFSSLDDGMAIVTSEGQISNNKNVNSTFAGYTVSADLTGDQSGKMKVDTSTGMLSYGKSETAITGSIYLLGKSVPVTIKIKKEISGKKI